MTKGTVGIIGGGQLGRMMAIAAREMGYRIAVLNSAGDSPCGQIADTEILHEFSDPAAYRKLADASDVMTYEWENIDADFIDGFPKIPQGVCLLRVSQNRLNEKQFIQECGFKTARYQAVRSKKDLKTALSIVGCPSVLKTTRGGYDGKGQVIIQDQNDLEQAHELLSSECILEQFIDFKKEISVVAARGVNGESEVFPLCENIHQNNILHQTIFPARVSNSVRDHAYSIARKILEKSGYHGTMAVEMFLDQNDEIIINEMAPRPHNSGHYTVEGCNISQFKQHIRAICGLPLTPVRLIQPGVMVNILGQHNAIAEKQLADPKYKRVSFHFYGKNSDRENRKTGHLTVLADTADEALSIANGILNCE